MRALNVNARNNAGLTALMTAAANGHLQAAKVLLKEGKVDINTRDGKGDSAVRYAIISGHSDIVGVLLAAGARLSFEDNLDCQRKTMEVIRLVAITIESHAVDENAYPVETAGKLENIRDKLEPKYTERLPLLDGWGHELRYYCPRSQGSYYIISFGYDGKQDVGLYRPDDIPLPTALVETTNSESDIIFTDGSFVRYPRWIAQEQTK